MKERMEKETEIMKFEEYLIDADPENIRCIDDRADEEGEDNAVQLPGGIYYLLDVCKRLKGDSEESARQRILKAGIKPGVHGHCGYAHTVEEHPDAVGAIESVSEEERQKWAREKDGKVGKLKGEHAPKYAVLNYKEGKTFNTNRATEEGKGTFSIDIWYLKKVAEKLGIEEEKLIDDAVVTFKKTVTELSGISDFQEIGKE